VSLLAEIALTVDPAPWRALGLDVLGDGTSQVGLVRLRFGADVDALGVAMLDGSADVPVTIDGVAAFAAEVPDGDPSPNPLGALRIDHVVVGTPDLGRTVGAFETALRVPVRRVRTEPTGSGARLHQAFFRLGEAVLEIVGPPEVDAARAADPARLSGLVLTVADIDDACGRLGEDVVARPKDAVQRGRRIATVRRDAGLGWPVALISD
jgi:hypothetical protein